ncbi:MAG: hypothetical protein QOJ70_1033, partial [Acidobacteriota bacterium]|nr:hypothetical protein [Acidobacteriota bacterium]
NASLIDPAVAAANSTTNLKSGYFFGIGPKTDYATGYTSNSTHGSTNTGSRNFISDEAGVIYAKVSSSSTALADTSGTSPIGN